MHRHLLRIAYGSTMKFTFLFHRIKIESIRSRSVNHSITTLLFASSKYYDGSVALWFISSVIQQSQSFFLIRNKEFFFYFRTLSHINIVRLGLRVFWYKNKKFVTLKRTPYKKIGPFISYSSLDT